MIVIFVASVDFRLNFFENLLHFDKLIRKTLRILLEA